MLFGYGGIFMNVKSVTKKLVRKMIGTKKEKTQTDKRSIKESNKKPYQILLLTNRDSDNVGDQVIEACDIGLIHTVMQNLGVDSSEYCINSRAAGFISKQYLSTRDPQYLKRPEKIIKETDFVVFGGAPMFNYAYQDFYERTAVILEFAQKYNKPVIFSAIGIEGYDEDNAKCQRLKKTLNFDCVKQITTRDDYESLVKYKTNENIEIAKVSDPAVFSAGAFKEFLPEVEHTKKKIGLFIIRGNAFKDNGFKFFVDDAVAMWKGLIQEIKAQGYDYKLLTSGHFRDEAFIEYLVRNHGVEINKCAFNMNSPEELIPEIASCDAIISCRLHPSIISFALDIPSLGIVWNNKVKYFYESFDCGDRLVSVDNINPSAIVAKLEEIIEQGVEKNKEDLCSVYNYLFSSFKNVLKPEVCGIEPYNYDEIIKNMPAYKTVSVAEKNEKLQRKFRRVYEAYNKLNAKDTENKKKIKALQEKIKELEKLNKQ